MLSALEFQLLVSMTIQYRYSLHKSRIGHDHPKDRGYDLETGQI